MERIIKITKNRGGVSVESGFVGGVPYTYPITRGFYAVYLPPSANTSFVMHEVAHILVYDYTNYNLVSGLWLNNVSLPPKEVLNKFVIADTYMINPLKDVLADAVAVKLFPEHIVHLEKEDKASAEIVRKKKGYVAILHKLLLIIHSGYTPYSIKDRKLEKYREVFSKTMKKEDARTLIRYMVEAYVEKLLRNLGFKIKSIELITDDPSGLIYDLLILEVR